MTFPDSVIVEVTAEDIAKGARAICTKCPIALAVQRCTGMLASARGSMAWLCTTKFSDGVALYDVPLEVADFMWAFDNANPVSPFTFTMTRMQ